MIYQLPFTEEMVRESICGRTLAYAYKRSDNHIVRKMKELKLAANPGDDGLNWRIDKGRLMLLDDRTSVTDMINGLEVINDQVIMMGEAYHLSGPVPGRLMLYEKNELGTDFQVVISSHVNYEADTVSRVVKSLLRAGVSEDAITVVVGGGEDGELTVEKGYRRLGIKKDLYGCTGLVPIIDGRIEIQTSYVLLMHDTCEAAFNFAEAVKAIDVGVPYDFIGGFYEIGLWSTKFLTAVAAGGLDITIETPRRAFDNIKDRCNLSRAQADVYDLKSKDVYGNGNGRMVKDITEFGIKKYLGSNAASMKP